MLLRSIAKRTTPSPVVIISLSGAGKRAAIGILEDVFQYGAVTKVDPKNLMALVQDHLPHIPLWKHVAVNLAMREMSSIGFREEAEAYVKDCVSALEQLRETRPTFKILFLDCAQKELACRQSYGFHPLKAACGTLAAAIFKESEVLNRLFRELVGRFGPTHLAYIDTSGPKQISQLRDDIERHLESELDPPVRSQDLATRGWNNMRNTLEQVTTLAKAFDTPARSAKERKLNCLIVGETGTGKEHIAKMLHPQGRPFQVIDCTGIPNELLESELWGITKGAFTGASRDRDGLVSQAGKGTLFLDEIGLTDKNFQGKLLRFIETRTYRRLGDTRTRQVPDCQIIAATSRNLEDEARLGTFLPDLYYRLAAITITTPPLRERREDISLLIERFAPKARFSAEALTVLVDYEWPGNVRELKQVIELCDTFTSGRQVELGDLPSRITQRYPGAKEFHDHLKDIQLTDLNDGPTLESGR